MFSIYLIKFLTNNANDAKIVIITKANPTIIVEIKILPKLLTVTPESQRLT